MSLRLDVIYRDMLSKSRLERIALAKRAKNNIEAYARKNGLSKEKAEEFVMYYFRLFVAADGAVDQKERDLFNTTFGLNLSKIAFDRLIGPYDKSFIDKMAKVTRKMPTDLQNDVAILGLTILCGDNEITLSESRLLQAVIDFEEVSMTDLLAKK